MLKLVWLSQQACRETLWKEFDPSKQIWILNDRKSKLFRNRDLLEKHQLIHEPVKRAKEFWRELLRLTDPEMRLVEELGGTLQARQFLLHEGKAEWTRRPRAPQKLLSACENLASLITHSEARDVLGHFAEEFGSGATPAAPSGVKAVPADSFVELALLCVEFYERCLEKKRLPVFGVPFYLAQKEELPLRGQNLIFDLGFELRGGERDLIQRLSIENEVTVLVPAANSEQVEDDGLFAYRNFGLGAARVENVSAEPPRPPISPQLELWRCSSRDAEARKAVELIVEWVEGGVPPEKICVAAERISDYENILTHDLEWEGIGLSRPLKTRLSASRLFRALNARLLIVQGRLRGALMEEAFLSVADYKSSSRRREERSVLKPILHEAQIPQADLKNKILALQHKRRSGSLSLSDFESLLVELFSDLVEVAETYEDKTDAEARNQLFLKALGQLRSEVGDAAMDFSLWVEAWEEITNQIRFSSEQGAEKGVWAVDLSSAEEVSAPLLIILGANESATRSNVAGTLGEAKLSFLAKLGFDLTVPVKRLSDMLMQRALSGNRKHLVFSCPRTDSRGKSVPASPLWLKLAAGQNKDLDQLDYARRTRWIDVQKTITVPETGVHVDAFKNWPQGTCQKIAGLVTQELDSTRRVVLPEQSAKPLSIPLSASRVESYWECPFKFFARSYLGLFDEADLEVEPTPQKRGQWLHAAAEEIFRSPKELQSWSDDELSSLVDSLDPVQKQISSDIWSNIRARFVRQLRRFINHEGDWRKKYPRASVLHVEAPFHGIIEWLAEKQNIHFASLESPPEEGFWADFRGSVDRVDGAAGDRAIILDYKTSASASANIASWSKRGQFQLALYTLATEAGLLPFGTRSVIAAQYFSLKKLNRSKGYVLSDEDLSGVLPTEGNSRAAVSREARDKYFQEIGVLVHEVLEGIRGGRFDPVPENEKICNTCSWRTSCRAPHLS